jgi:hypothetical protein
MVECRASPLLSSILTNPLNLREKLLIELGGITSADLTTTWARQALTAKNSLTVGDASLVEEAFEQLVAELSSPRAAPEATAPTNDVALRCKRRSKPPPRRSRRSPLVAVFKRQQTSTRACWRSPPPRRYRNRDHLRFVAQQPCLICGRKPSDPHHLRHTQPAALGRKPSDGFAVPLCRAHTAPLTAPATNGRGGRPPASIRCRPPVSCGDRRHERGARRPDRIMQAAEADARQAVVSDPAAAAGKAGRTWPT